MRRKSQASPEETLNIYFPYFLEIRKRLFFILSVFLIASVLGFIYYDKLIPAALKLFALEGVNIVFTSPFQFLTLAVTAGLTVGIIAVFPFIIYQVLSFLKPALKSYEFNRILHFLPLSITLFVGGFAFGMAMMRYVLVIFYTRSQALDIGNFLDVSKLLSQILLTSVLMGVAFQLPIVLTLLIRLGVLKYKQVVEKRLLAYALSLIFAALLPPTDLISLIFLFLPIALLFEITLLLNRYLLKSHLL